MYAVSLWGFKPNLTGAISSYLIALTIKANVHDAIVKNGHTLNSNDVVYNTVYN